MSPLSRKWLLMLLLVVMAASFALVAQVAPGGAQSQPAPIGRLPLYDDPIGISPSGSALVSAALNPAAPGIPGFQLYTPLAPGDLLCKTVFVSSVDVAMFSCGVPRTTLVLTIEEADLPHSVVAHSVVGSERIASSNPQQPSWVNFSFGDTVSLHAGEHYRIKVRALSRVVVPLSTPDPSVPTQVGACPSAPWGPHSPGIYWSLDSSNPYSAGAFSGNTQQDDALATVNLGVRTDVKILAVNYDPIIESQGGKRLSEFTRDYISDYIIRTPTPIPGTLEPPLPPGILPFEDPSRLIRDGVVALERASAGVVNFSVEIWNLDAFPPRKQGGVDKTYTDTKWVDDLKSGDYPGQNLEFCDGCFSYEDLLETSNGGQSIVQRVNAGEIDEVWLMGDPTAGFCESLMVIPVGGTGHRVNCGPKEVEVAPPLTRNAVVMGFSMERRLAEWLEAYSHRAEDSVLFSGVIPTAQWGHFVRLDRNFPGQGSVGNPHNAFNARILTPTPTAPIGQPTPTEIDDPEGYDFSNRRFALSDAAEWYHYPFMSSQYVQANCNQLIWACTDDGYFRWWYDHLPKYIPTGSDPAQTVSNWWPYIANPVCMQEP